jgi:hypothetical protein
VGNTEREREREGEERKRVHIVGLVNGRKSFRGATESLISLRYAFHIPRLSETQRPRLNPQELLLIVTMEIVDPLIINTGT